MRRLRDLATLGRYTEFSSCWSPSRQLFAATAGFSAQQCPSLATPALTGASKGCSSCRARAFASGPAQDDAVTPAARSQDGSVNVKSFLLGSYFDLARLKSQDKYRKFVLAEGKDYMVLSFNPSDTRGTSRSARPDTFVQLNGPNAAAVLPALSPHDTYFVLFRYGAVVLFQGSSPDQHDSATLTRPSAPAPGTGSPWQSNPEAWEAAAYDDAQLIYLLLKPFMQENNASIDPASNILAMEAPFPVHTSTGTHTHIPTPLPDDAAAVPVTFSLGPKRSSPGSQPVMYNESVSVSVRPQLASFMTQEPETSRLIVKQLDVGVLRCIGSALGQSCAIDFYSGKVDQALQLAQKSNMDLLTTGSAPKAEHFSKVIGYCSLIHGAVISQLGLFDKNDIAWQFANYDKVVEVMRNEFELENRRSQLMSKIEVVAKNAETLVHMQHNTKSMFLEQMIVTLFTVEIVVSLFDINLTLLEHGHANGLLDVSDVVLGQIKGTLHGWAQR